MSSLIELNDLPGTANSHSLVGDAEVVAERGQIVIAPADLGGALVARAQIASRLTRQASGE